MVTKNFALVYYFRFRLIYTVYTWNVWHVKWKEEKGERQKKLDNGQLLLTLADKQQTQPLIRDGASQRPAFRQNRKSHSGLDTKTYWLSVGRNMSSASEKYGYGFCATLALEWLHYKLQTRPLAREGAPQKQDSNLLTESNIWSQVPEWARHQAILTDWPSVV
jgi:hypothetical protein